MIGSIREQLNSSLCFVITVHVQIYCMLACSWGRRGGPVVRGCLTARRSWVWSPDGAGPFSTIRRGDYPTLANTQRFSSVIHEMYGCKWVDSVSGCVLGAYRGGEGRVKVRWREVSFICIWHTSLLCYSDSTIILITVCLPLPPSPSYFCFSWQERWCIYRQICSTFSTSLSNPAMKKSYLCRYWRSFASFK